MPLHRALPRREQLVIIFLFVADTALVLDLGEFGGPLLVHAVLEVATHRAIAFTHLTQHIRLVRLAVKCLLQVALFVHLVLAVDFLIDLLLLVVAKPVLLLLQGLLKKDSLLTVLVDVLEQVDAGLIFTSPLLLSCVPLFLILLHRECIDVPLLGLLVRALLLVVLLKLLDLASARKPLFLFEVLHGLLIRQRFV